MGPSTLSVRTLRRRVLSSLREQGLELGRDGLLRAPPSNKEALRRVHASAREARIAKSKDGLARHEARLLRLFASGSDVEPEAISPRLIEVTAKSEQELLFRYARLHWSIPVSAGYGRRLRFLVLDENNEKLIGLIGLGDPVAALGARDSWIGWSGTERRLRLRNVMDAFVLGAVPPYSQLLGGKLVAMLATSNEVRSAFRRKYGRGQNLISERPGDGRLALITTSSALGRSSVYNRLKFDDQSLYLPVGFTSGSGEFHLSNGVYSALFAYARSVRAPSAKHSAWGNGWRSRREVLRIVLPKLGFDQDLLYHGIRREVFVVPLADNCREFLRGDHSRLRQSHLPMNDLFQFFRERWLLPRAQRRPEFVDWKPADLRLWSDS